MAFTFEEWVDEHYDSNKPIEPDTENVDPKQWAKIAFYAQDKLRDAFEAGCQYCCEKHGLLFSKDRYFPQKNREFLFYFVAEKRWGVVTSDMVRDEKI